MGTEGLQEEPANMKADAGRIFSFMVLFKIHIPKALTPVQFLGLSLKRTHQVLIRVHHLQPPLRW